MAWNEPGGDKKDPWGGRGDQQPPDLDEMLRKIQARFGGLLGGKGGRGGAGVVSGGGSSLGFSVILVVLLVAWVLSGVYIIDEGRRGVVTQFGAYKETSMPGPHWLPKFVQAVDVVDVDTVRSAPIRASMLTQDENIVNITLAVQYKIKDAKSYLFNVAAPDLTLKQATESAVREIIGRSNMDFIITEGRSDISLRTKDLLQETLDQYRAGLVVERVNLQDAQPPEEVQGAFEDAIRAREDEVRLKNEAEAYANDIIPRARGAAARQSEEANGYKDSVIARAEGEVSRFTQLLTEFEKAPAVTRERLYIDAMESVLSNTSKVVVDVEGGNSLMYLPLDKLMQRSQGVTGSETPSGYRQDAVPARSSPSGTRSRDNLRSREVSQ